MSTHASATFEVKHWDEKPFNEIDGGPKLTRVSVSKSFQGDIDGEGTLEYLMMHRNDGTADFVGLERVTGRLGDLSGSFVLLHRGTFASGTAKATCVVVAGSGTGELAGLRGEGFFEAKSRQAPITLDYDIE
ncbi:MAG: DUF3224 domain-containing protein [Candidatus Krumholzibacteria bacterium]|nr:DUF3224 domain-containing protein [Candidatus Krumholzibacteria bacterium]